MGTVTAPHSSSGKPDQLPVDPHSCPGSSQCQGTDRDEKPTRVQKSHFQSTFQGAEQLLPLVSSFQAELEVLHSRLRLWEICKPSSDQEQCQALRGGRGRQCGTPERSHPPSPSPRVEHLG